MALETLQYGTVTGRFIAAVADTPDDPDVLPDAIPLSGTILFVPSVKSVQIITAQGGPTTVALMPVEAHLDIDGYVSHNGTRGITLIASDNPSANPSNITWNVTANLKLNNSEVKLPSWNIQVSHTQSNDLTVNAPVSFSPGISTTRGMTFTSIRSENSNLIFTLEDGTELPPVLSPYSGFFVQPTEPNLTRPGIWVQTGLGADQQGFTFWIEDGNF